MKTTQVFQKQMDFCRHWAQQMLLVEKLPRKKVSTTDPELAPFEFCAVEYKQAVKYWLNLQRVQWIVMPTFDSRWALKAFSIHATSKAVNPPLFRYLDQPWQTRVWSRIRTDSIGRLNFFRTGNRITRDVKCDSAAIVSFRLRFVHPRLKMSSSETGTWHYLELRQAFPSFFPPQPALKRTWFPKRKPKLTFNSKRWTKRFMSHFMNRRAITWSGRITWFTIYGFNFLSAEMFQTIFGKGKLAGYSDPEMSL